jgi:hypothetical protein
MNKKMNPGKTSSHAAFWISPDGLIFKVGTSHIAEIIRKPDIFGLNIKHIRQIYKEHGEPLGHEGKARNIIVREVISRGWIRLRRYPNKYWKVNLTNLSNQVYQTLNLWAKQMLRSGVAGFIEGDGYLPVIIIHPDAHFEYRATMNELAQNQDIQKENFQEAAP